MADVLGMSDPNYLGKQYRDGSNLNARIRLHQLFSVNRYIWQRWLFDQMQLKPHIRVLELGCGTGEFWLENMDRIPKGMEVILSDFSEGMVDQIMINLKHLPHFIYKVIDAQSIPFEEEYFDIVIANHMLFHLPDREKGLSEIKRVLKPSGWLYASTIGKNNLLEINEMVTRFEPQFATWNTLASDSFSLENGGSQLEQHFAHISLFRYTDSLIITEAKPLIDYILSGRLQLSDEQKIGLAIFVESELAANHGQLTITKDSGMFSASKVQKSG